MKWTDAQNSLTFSIAVREVMLHEKIIGIQENLFINLIHCILY